MLSPRQLLNTIGLGDLFAAIDLTDTYFHVVVHPDHRQFLVFTFEGTVYEHLVLPFDLSLAPCTFTAHLRERGVHILVCLDGWALIASKYQLPPIIFHNGLQSASGNRYACAPVAHLAPVCIYPSGHDTACSGDCAKSWYADIISLLAAWPWQLNLFICTQHFGVRTEIYSLYPF